MWLLKLHIAFSILCILSAAGVKVVFAERLKRYKTEHDKKKFKLRNWLLFFCPGINVLIVVGVYFMAFCDDETAREIVDRNNK